MSAQPRTLLADLGNTRVKLALLGDDGRAGPSHAVAHAGDPGRLDALVLPDAACAVFASVAPPALTVALLQRLLRGCARVSRVRTQPVFGGVRIAYVDPMRLGVDRFLALLAARAQGEGAALVVGVGTALTIDLLDAGGLHRGGRIAPSPTLMRDALHARAAQLPPFGGRYREFADDTADALASGCEGAALALVEHSLAQAAALLGVAPRLLLHGGGAPALRTVLPPGVSHVPDAVLDGMALWAGATRDGTA